MDKITNSARLSKWIFLIVFSCIVSNKTNAQFYAVKVDLLGLCTTTLNVEGSMAIRNQWTIHLPVKVNPWVIDEKSYKQITAMPGVRYWFIDSYSRGWFLGVNGVLTTYNHSGLIGNRISYYARDHRYKGTGYGVGVSGGFSVPLTKRFNMEFEVGVAGIYANHDIYSEEDGRNVGYQKGILPVPGKIGINMVYLF